MLRLIQLYRGLAAISVVAFHLSIEFGDPRYYSHDVLRWLTWRMNLGVDFFFVLSGFIILMAHESDLNRPSRYGRFWVKRFIRIYPIYWIYAGGFCALVLVGLGTAATVPHGAGQWISTFSLVRLENFLTPISPAWTLFHEIAFYAVFSLMIVNVRLGTAAFLLWQIVCAALMIYPEPDQRTPFNVYLSAYNLDFVIGMAAYLAYRRGFAPRPLPWLVASIVVLATTYAADANGSTFVALPLMYALGFGMLLLGSALWERQRGVPPLAPCVFLGDASYTIYLTHEPLMGLFLKVAVKARFLAGYLHPVYVAILLLTICAASVLHLVVERPVLSFGRRLLTPGARRQLAGLAAEPAPAAAPRPRWS
jgi:peptidoglycan/LPS O-acetylase OafA/YrhL